MAEILFKAVDATNADPEKDARGCYKRGDPVVIKEDGWNWDGKEVIPPRDGGKFVVIKIPGVTVEQVHTTIRNKWPQLRDLLDGERAENGELTRRMAIRLAVDSLPANVRTQLNTTGTYTTTWQAIRTFIFNKMTRENP